MTDILDKNVIKFSILIPITRKKRVIRLIFFLLDILKEDDEIIGIVDTCLKDYEELNLIFKKYKNVIIKFSGDKNGPAICRNIGIMVSKNEYIVLFDDDVIPVKNILDEYRNCFSYNNVSACAGDIKLIFKKNTWVSFYLKHQKFTWIHDFNSNIFISCNFAFKKQRDLYFDERFSFSFEDIAFSLNFRDKNVKFCKKALVYHEVFHSFYMFLIKFYEYGKGRRLFLKYYPEESVKKKKFTIFNTIYNYFTNFKFRHAFILTLFEILKYLAYYLGFLLAGFKY